jgi:hypothetical protein
MFLSSAAQERPAPILSLNEFFEATGTGFMKDVLGMTGVDLGNKRRKSMALGALGRERQSLPFLLNSERLS